MTVLTTGKSTEELGLAEHRGLLQQTLSRCIQAASQYAVELNSTDAALFRANLERLVVAVTSQLNEADYNQLGSDFRGELRDYHGKTQREADRLRSEMDSLIESMQGLITNVATSGSDHERTLKEEFKTLQATAQLGDLSTIQNAIQHAADTAIKSCGEIRRSCEVVIAQLQDEIRNLHREVDQERRAAMSDHATGIWNRAKLDNRIKDLILLNEPFCVFLIGIPNLVQVSRRDTRLVPGLLRALAGRVQSLAGKGGEVGMAGRWSEEVFAIVFNLPLSGVPQSPDSMQKALSASYMVQIEGSAFEIPLAPRVGAVERPKGANESAFYLQLGHAAFEAVTH